MSHVHPSVDGFIATKEDSAKIERIQDELVGFKRQLEGVEKDDLSVVLPPSPISPSPSAPKTSSEAGPGSSSASASTLRVVSSIPPAGQQPSPPLKRPSPNACVPAVPSLSLHHRNPHWPQSCRCSLYCRVHFGRILVRRWTCPHPCLVGQ